MLEYFNRYADTTGKEPLGVVFEAVDGQLSTLKQEAAKGPAGVDQTTIKMYTRLLELLHFTEGQMKLRGLPTVGKCTEPQMISCKFSLNRRYCLVCLVFSVQVKLACPPSTPRGRRTSRCRPKASNNKAVFVTDVSCLSQLGSMR
jgi:hypothetical protein